MFLASFNVGFIFTIFTLVTYWNFFFVLFFCGVLLDFTLFLSYFYFSLHSVKNLPKSTSHSLTDGYLLFRPSYWDIHPPCQTLPVINHLLYQLVKTHTPSLFIVHIFLLPFFLVGLPQSFFFFSFLKGLSLRFHKLFCKRSQTGIEKQWTSYTL